MVLLLFTWCKFHGVFSWFFCSSVSLRQGPSAWAWGVRSVRLSVPPSEAHSLYLLLFVRVGVYRQDFLSILWMSFKPCLLSWEILCAIHSLLLPAWQQTCALYQYRILGRTGYSALQQKQISYDYYQFRMLMGTLLAFPSVSPFLGWGEWDRYLPLLQRPIIFPLF